MEVRPSGVLLASLTHTAQLSSSMMTQVEEVFKLATNIGALAGVVHPHRWNHLSILTVSTIMTPRIKSCITFKMSTMLIILSTGWLVGPPLFCIVLTLFKGSLSCRSFTFTTGVLPQICSFMELSFHPHCYHKQYMSQDKDQSAKIFPIIETNTIWND